MVPKLLCAYESPEELVKMWTSGPRDSDSVDWRYEMKKALKWW